MAGKGLHAGVKRRNCDLYSRAFVVCRSKRTKHVFKMDESKYKPWADRICLTLKEYNPLP